MADEGNFRNSALLQGVKARCGPAVLELGSYGQYLKDLLTNGPCNTYEELKNEYNFSYEGRRIIKAVMSPFAANDFDPGTQMGQLGMGDLQNSHRQRG